MSWIQSLSETYDFIEAQAGEDRPLPWPPAHMAKKAHVEIAIDAEGNFRRARKLDRAESVTMIPTTEASAGRTAGDAPHPLCEELSYCAGDLPGLESDRFDQYVRQLREWCESSFAHPKASAVLAYVQKKTLWADLAKEAIFPMQTEGAQGSKTKVADEKVFVRWSIEAIGDPCSGTWMDLDLQQAWTKFDASKNTKTGFCMVSGTSTRLAQNHPRFVRGSGDGAKFISANDFGGLTFKGRFTDSKTDYEKQACSVGFDVSQKAHSALRWLISRQGSRSDGQVIVAWAPHAIDVPDPMAGTYELLGIDSAQMAGTRSGEDFGQTFAIQLNKAIHGYQSRLAPSDRIVVMGLDSATPGRMAITYYREIKGSEFLERIKGWHARFAWPMSYGKRQFIGAPSPKDIAQAIFGGQLEKSVRERLLPCIVDGMAVPTDLVEAARRRAANRAGFKKDEWWEWEKCLGIACALFKGKYAERNYEMALETERTSRDYLYGRLLAIAENLESFALKQGDEQRETTAARLMQRFADRPASTWRTISLALSPYLVRLGNRAPGFLVNRKQLLDDVVASFQHDDFVLDAPLTGEFLLGYHCQRQALLKGADKPDGDQTATND